MAFYKKLPGGDIVNAGMFVYGLDYSLLADQHNDYTYPVDGWYWFDDDNIANRFLTKTMRVTRAQAKFALDDMPYGEGTLYDAINAMMSNPATPKRYRIAWEDSVNFERTSEILAVVGQMFGLTDADLDALFERAATYASF